jgi:flagellar basal-body rod protein FlgG
MNMSFYAAAVGAAQQQLRMGVQSNNIANVNTYGFKAEKPSFSALMYADLVGINNANLPKGAGARMILADNDFAGGFLRDTGYEHDYSIVGDGFFALQDPQTGEISYTRDGSFTKAGYQDEYGEQAWRLSDGDGRWVLGEDWEPIELPAAPGESAQFTIGVFDFINTNGMHPVGANRFLPVPKNGDPYPVQNGQYNQGFLEASNVDLANEMVKVIEAQRSFTYALKMVQTSDEIETTVNGLR